MMPPSIPKYSVKMVKIRLVSFRKNREVEGG